MILTDTHTHLFAEEFSPDMDEVILRAIEKGVKRFFLPNIDSTTAEKMLSLAKKYPANFFPMMGLHPNSVKENFEEELNIVEMYLSASPLSSVRVSTNRNEKVVLEDTNHGFVAVGETGLDFYWDLKFVEEQKIVFQKQVELAIKKKLPIIIHARTDAKKTSENALEEIIKIISSLIAPHSPLTGIFHCFTGTVEDAEKIIALGFYLGIGGAVTFKNSGLQEVIEQMDMKHLVLETDSPYVTPVPFRGKRNESGYLIFVAEKIAQIKKISVEEVALITTENSKRIFNV